MEGPAIGVVVKVLTAGHRHESEYGVVGLIEEGVRWPFHVTFNGEQCAGRQGDDCCVFAADELEEA